MMPLSLADIGEENTIKKIGGSAEVKQHLENLGFVVGGNVTVITALGGNVIVNVKESRVAISEEMARKIMVAWIAENIVTIIICEVLVAMVAAIIVSLVKDKKKGKSSCGCKCGSCPMAGSCHSKK